MQQPAEQVAAAAPLIALQNLFKSGGAGSDVTTYSTGCCCCPIALLHTMQAVM